MLERWKCGEGKSDEDGKRKKRNAGQDAIVKKIKNCVRQRSSFWGEISPPKYVRGSPFFFVMKIRHFDACICMCGGERERDTHHDSCY